MVIKSNKKEIARSDATKKEPGNLIYQESADEHQLTNYSRDTIIDSSVECLARGARVLEDSKEILEPKRRFRRIFRFLKRNKKTMAVEKEERTIRSGNNE